MRTTTLAKFCDNLLEACWLAALIVAPTFYNLFSSRVFEPDKIALLRTLALVMLAAWAVKAGETQGWQLQAPGHWRTWTMWRQPLFWPVAGLITANLLATIFSVTPQASVWGSYVWAEGLYTLLAYATFFSVVAANLRRPEQVQRLMGAVILTASAESGYGLIQKLQLDPMPWAAQTAGFISGSLGNSSFFAGYLILAVPLTALRLFQTITSAVSEAVGRPGKVARAILYAALLILQLSAIYFSGSRGAWLGLLAGMFLIAGLACAKWGRKPLTAAVLGGAVLVLALLGLLNIQNGPLEGMRNDAYLGRLGHLFESQDTSSQIRDLNWHAAAQMALPHAAIAYPNNTTDVFNPIRPLIGYGPESTGVAFYPFYASQIAQSESRPPAPDRMHNVALDILLTTGALGLLAYLFFLAASLYWGLSWLGLVTAKDRWPFGLAVGLGSVAGAIGLILWRGAGYVGLGVSLGGVAGLLLYVSALALTRPLGQMEPWRVSLLIILEGAVLAHFVEAQFSIPVAATQLQAWLYLGLLAAVGYGWQPAAQPVKSKASPVVGVDDNRATVWAVFIGGLLLITLTFEFLAPQGTTTNLPALLYNSLTSVYGQQGLVSAAIPSLLALVWLAGAVMLGGRPRQVGLTLTVTLLIVAAFSLYQGLLLVYITNQLQADPTALSGMPVFINLITGFAGWMLAFTILTAISLVMRQPQLAATPWARWAMAALLAVGLWFVALFFNLQPIQADMLGRVAGGFSSARAYDKAIAIYRQAVGFAPTEDFYFRRIAQAQINQAQTTSDLAQRLNQYKTAIRNLTTAQRLNPLQPAVAVSLAQANQLAAQLAQQPDAASFSNAADDGYAQALRLDPYNTDSWNAWARLNLTTRNDPASALQHIQSSLAVDSHYGPTYAVFGDYWAVLGNLESDAAVKQTHYEQAASYYQQALSLQPDGALTVRLSLGQVQTALKQYDAAIATFNDLIERAPDASNVWLVYNSLAKAYLGKGDKIQALENAFLAYNYAPDHPSKEQVQAFIDQVK